MGGGAGHIHIHISILYQISFGVLSVGLMFPNSVKDFVVSLNMMSYPSVWS